ncbi:MAG TPA: selenide, water dikinase SelD [Polyangiaceae bacterium]|nr:selenide, water dikinase SelD [Polyangiaceae bacterium]
MIEADMAKAAERLTQLAHGGGCGCKLAPGVLHEILARMPVGNFPGLLVGTETSDDAAVYRLNDSQALVATTDFFMPMVDDPYDFGRIAATNALSDVYAMGGSPILALAILGVPVGKVSLEAVQQILAGGASVCSAAGVAVAGGHSIDNPEPMYGLVALGLVNPRRILRNSGARAGDRLILTKGLGVGIYSAAFKKGALPAPLYKEFLASTTQLNAVGAEMPDFRGVHALTDVTGFGLLGHLLEMCRGSGLGACIERSQLPLLPEVEQLARSGFVTGASGRNWSSYGAQVQLPAELPEWQRALLCDPQTSGGLLIAVSPEQSLPLLQRLAAAGFGRAAEIGEITSTDPVVRVV